MYQINPPLPPQKLLKVFDLKTATMGEPELYKAFVKMVEESDLESWFKNNSLDFYS